jgi:replicative DNA helicase
MSTHITDLAAHQLLSVILDEPVAYHQIAQLLGGRERAGVAFWRETHRALWRCLGRLADAHLLAQPLDLAIADDLGREEWEALQMKRVLAEIRREGAGIWGVTDHAADILTRELERRELQEQVSRWDIAAAAAHPAELRAQIQGWLTGASQDAQARRSTVGASELCDLWQEELDLARQEGGGGRLWRSGVPGLDEILGGGLSVGRYYVVGGLTKMGKTTLALRIAVTAARAGVAVTWVSVEMPHADMADRLLSVLSDVDVTAARADWVKYGPQALPAGQLDRILSAKAELATLPIEVRCEGAPDVRDIEAAAHVRRAQLGPHAPHLIVVDYAQNCTAGSSAPREEYAQLSEISRRLNVISKNRQLNAAVLAVVQFSKQAEDAYVKQGHAPRFAHIRGTSQFGNDANHLLVHHRPHAHSEDPARRGYTQVIQELSRHGHTGAQLHLELEMATARFHKTTPPAGSGEVKPWSK